MGSDKRVHLKVPIDDSREALDAFMALESKAAKHLDDPELSDEDRALFDYMKQVERDVEMVEFALAEFRSAASPYAPRAVLDLARARLRRHIRQLAWTSAWIYNNMDETGVFVKPESEG